MSDGILVKFDTRDLSNDPELRRLMLDFANAKLALETYLSEAMMLTLSPAK